MAENYECDGAGPHSLGKVYRLDTGGGSGVNLCHADWNREMEWRRHRNIDLSGWARFPIKAWPGKDRLSHSTMEGGPGGKVVSGGPWRRRTASRTARRRGMR